MTKKKKAGFAQQGSKRVIQPRVKAGGFRSCYLSNSIIQTCGKGACLRSTISCEHLWLCSYLLKHGSRTSPVVQWLGIRLPMQETWVPSLVQEDPTCHAAIKPVRYDYRACVKPWRCHSWAPNHIYWNKRSHHNEKPMPRKSRATPDHRKLEKSLRTAAKIQCSQKFIHILKNC